MIIGPAKSDGLMVVFLFSYELIGVTLHNSFKRHYIACMKDGQWLYYDGQLNTPNTQPLTAEIIQGSVTQHVLFVRQNKQQSTAVLQD